ncbi:methyltransferase [Pseudomaricurvus alkylphenolicus]|uniref:methyltransferase n=1 Tax=Pseudomaricurvus alkylphenolicus TaxID=1306991 RepID=UPI00142400A1|nr:methyltransferase [Pseudomaricurvus alkylphenolicus]NIB43748.1 methyltransferase [Pseudomaricurvus alkylphenolicus]
MIEKTAMVDPCFTPLLPYLQKPDGDTLWIADENLLAQVEHMRAHSQLRVISNRYDVWQGSCKAGLEAVFSDYDFSEFNDTSLDRVVYRVSKEKPVVHQVINQAWRILKPGGHLILSGAKNEGAKSFVDKASKLFGKKVNAQKLGNGYLGIICKHQAFDPDSCLDTKQYNQLRPVFEIAGREVFSKPGQFGWEKRDQGSALLIDTAVDYLQQRSLNPASILDLGCGYGYLTLRTADWPGIDTRWATDNNAAALATCAHNAREWGLSVEVIAGDAGAGIDRRFDLVLCNPPFHQGFQVESALTDKFLRNTRRLLQADGVALFVVNQFIGLEKRADHYFGQVEMIASDGQFKVLALNL